MSSSKKTLDHEKKKGTEHRGLIPTVGGAIGLLFVAPMIFYLVLPYFDLVLRPLIGNWVDLFRLIEFPWDVILSAGLGLIGFVYGLWAFTSLYKIGKGSAAPFVPTTKLVVARPYNYSRNPMAFGVILLYSAEGILFHSVAMVILVLLVMISPYILYIKFIEEKGLALRFGDDYIKYKRATRFLLPLPKRHRRT